MEWVLEEKENNLDIRDKEKGLTHEVSPFSLSLYN